MPNTRLHVSAPRELLQMQPALNGCRVSGITSAQLASHTSAGSVSFTTS
jgi:hypothetical protein